VEAVDGVDALKKLPPREINIILTDINMPVMDGSSWSLSSGRTPT